MAVEVIETCPLGSECVEVKNGAIHRCKWFIKLQGKDAMGKDHDTENCAIAWWPLLQVETSRQGLMQTAAINSMRNESIKRQDVAIDLMRQETDNVKVINAQ